MAAVTPEAVVARLHPWLTTVPDVPDAVADLLGEAALLDPARATDLATLAGTTSEEVAADQRALWRETSDRLYSVAAVTQAAGFSGVRPSPVAVEAWAQPWRPLHLAWRATWYPSSQTIEGSAPGTRELQDWQLDGDDYEWLGLSDFDHSRAVTLQGRCLLSGTSTTGLRDSLDALDARVSSAPADPRETAEERVERTARLAEVRAGLARVRTRLDSADLMTQTLTGFHDQLVQRDPDQSVEPDDDEVQQLLGDVDRVAPVPVGTLEETRFFPVRAGHARVRRLWLVDGFGQVFDLIHEQGQTEASYTPLRGRGLVTVGLSQRSDTQMLQFPPRLVQPSRLSMRFGDPGAPVAGWLLANHLDGSLMLYDGSGTSLGALLPWDSGEGLGVRWEPSPGAPPPAVGSGAADNARLEFVRSALENMSIEDFTAFLQAVDRTLWTTDPASRSADGTTVLVGRPIAVVGARLSVELDGPALADQSWPLSHLPPADDQRTGGLPGLRVAVRLGLPDAREDGTLGYFDFDEGTPRSTPCSRCSRAPPRRSTHHHPRLMTRRSTHHDPRTMLRRSPHHHPRGGPGCRSGCPDRPRPSRRPTSRCSSTPAER